MTYPDDPNLNPRRSAANETSYTGWIVGGIIALVVIVGIFIAVGNRDGTNTAATGTSPATSTGSPPATTGSGTQTPPAPAKK